MSNRSRGAMSHKEIGDLLGMSRQNVQLIELRAIKKLRKALGSKCTEPPGQFIVDSEGVPEPGENYRDYSTQKNVAGRRRVGGRFARE